MNSAPPQYSPGDMLAGKFKIVRTLGVGGMGAVYEVEHSLTKHRRALKLLHPELSWSPSIVERFLREASAAGRIGNPHVCETFDAGRLETGEPYIVMEFLKGTTLADEIAQTGPLELERACQVMVQACDGIAAAHAAGIVHRDLKPENMFLATGESVFVKILDFGISKFDPELTGAQGITQDGATIGTPFYMPPEQVLGSRDLDGQADVYALGVVLYECLTAQKPYFAETLPHLAVLICQGQYAPPSTRRPELPPGWDAVIGRAMAKEKASRYATVAELKQAIQQQRSVVSNDDATRARAKLLASPLSGGTQALADATPAITADAFERTQPEAKRRRPGVRGLWLAIGVGAALVAGWLLLQSGRGPSVESEAGSQVAAPPAAAPPPVPVAAVQPPAVSSPTPEASAKAPLASSSASAPKGLTAARPVTPLTSGKPAPGSVSKQLGLSEDNPF